MLQWQTDEEMIWLIFGMIFGSTYRRWTPSNAVLRWQTDEEMIWLVFLACGLCLGDRRAEDVASFHTHTEQMIIKHLFAPTSSKKNADLVFGEVDR